MQNVFRIAVIASIATCVGGAWAQAVNVDLEGELGTPASAYAAAGTAGFWNAIDLAEAEGGIIELDGLTGSSSGISMTLFHQGAAAGASAVGSLAGDALALMGDGWSVTDIPARISLSGLSAGEYELILYSSSGAVFGSSTAINVYTDSLSVDQFFGTSGSWSGDALVEGDSHVRTTFVIGDDETLRMDWFAGGLFGGIGILNGFQVRAIPAPGTGALAVFAACTAARRRRR